MALGEGHEKNSQGALSSTHPVPQLPWQVETHTSCVLAPGPQDQELCVALGQGYQEVWMQSVPQASSPLRGEGEGQDSEIILEVNKTFPPPYIPSPLGMALGKTNQDESRSTRREGAVPSATPLHEASWKMVSHQTHQMASSPQATSLQESQDSPFKASIQAPLSSWLSWLSVAMGQRQKSLQDCQGW